ncbi:hypothetical protein NEMIN01_1454 [Nematocida minor]|uniref:uncharacterized protein n=1 Tax=Nematocida minor TaxID=1912983 RepID=UPI00221F3DDD|nr:uncharacterized protein NEMIN01_1454 [Nematocida minor]KAI5191295.1 hypothetical protein NEMIN01_1454 [Nematocida minor]
MESSEPAVGQQYQEIEDAQTVERTLSIKIVYNYSEKTILVTISEDILEKIKRKAHELFGLSCIRLEIDRKPVTAPEQIFNHPSAKITVVGIKNKCMLEKCKNRVNPTSDLECKFCCKSFCIKHSIPEGHACENISDCKEKAAQENLKKLLSSGRPSR